MDESENPGVQANIEQYTDIKIVQYDSTWGNDERGEPKIFSKITR